jgi:hypothetical protein
MTAKEAISEILDEAICLTKDDADEFIEELEKRGYMVVAMTALLEETEHT